MPPNVNKSLKHMSCLCRTKLRGVILIKELALHDLSEGIPVTRLHIRTLPYVRADTAMYDVFKVFQSGHSHMMVLTQPHPLCDVSELSSGTAGCFKMS